MLTPLWNRSLLVVAAVISLAASGCDTGPLLCGKWLCDDTAVVQSNSGAAESDTREYFAPVPKFDLQLTPDGKCIVTYNENGADKTREGTWRMVKDESLKWQIATKLPPENLEQEVMVGSPDNRSLSMEIVGSLKGGPIYLKRKSY